MSRFRLPLYQKKIVSGLKERRRLPEMGRLEPAGSWMI